MENCLNSANLVILVNNNNRNLKECQRTYKVFNKEKVLALIKYKILVG